MATKKITLKTKLVEGVTRIQATTPGGVKYTGTYDGAEYKDSDHGADYWSIYIETQDGELMAFPMDECSVIE